MNPGLKPGRSEGVGMLQLLRWPRAPGGYAYVVLL